MLRSDGLDVVVMHVGSPSRELVQRLGAGYRCEGVVSPQTVSERLSAMDVLLLPYPDGVSGRRTAFMAGLQHGCAIAGTYGAATEGLLKVASGEAYALSACEDLGGWCQNVRLLVHSSDTQMRLRDNARRMYSDTFGWPHVAKRCLDGLGSVR